MRFCCINYCYNLCIIHSYLLNSPLAFFLILNLFMTLKENVWWVILVWVQHKARKYTELSLALYALHFLMTIQQFILCLVWDTNSKAELMILSENNTHVVHEIYSRKGEAAVWQWPTVQQLTECHNFLMSATKKRQMTAHKSRNNSSFW